MPDDVIVADDSAQETVQETAKGTEEVKPESEDVSTEEVTEEPTVESLTSTVTDLEGKLSTVTEAARKWETRAKSNIREIENLKVQLKAVEGKQFSQEDLDAAITETRKAVHVETSINHVRTVITDTLSKNENLTEDDVNVFMESFDLKSFINDEGDADLERLQKVLKPMAGVKVKEETSPSTTVWGSLQNPKPKNLGKETLSSFEVH